MIKILLWFTFVCNVFSGKVLDHFDEINQIRNGTKQLTTGIFNSLFV